MVNAGFKYGDSNNQHGTNSGILGGQQNYIAFGADNCHLIGCENVVVAGNVVNFVGVNLTNQYIDYTFSNQTIIGKNDPRILRVTADFTIDGNALPYTTGLVTYKAITVYSNGTTLHIISAN